MPDGLAGWLTDGLNDWLTDWLIVSCKVSLTLTSWEANSRSVAQEIPRLLQNPKVYYRVWKNPPLVKGLCEETEGTSHQPTRTNLFLLILRYETPEYEIKI
jgi:hypothetical protein